MPLRERAARRERTDPDRGSCFLRNLHHQIDGLGAIDGRADHEGGMLAGRQRCRQRLHGLGIGTDLAAERSRGQRLCRMHPVVARDRHESRPARRLHRGVIGARDRGRHVLRPRRLDAVFHIRPRKLRGALGIEEWLQRQDRTRLLARDDHQRRLVAPGGEDVPERVAEAGRRVQIDEAGVARGLRIAVGHADHARLLQAEHVIDVVGPVGEKRQFGRARIAEDFLDAEGTQQVESGLLDGDRAVLRRLHHVAVPFMVGWPSALAVHSSSPAPLSLALTENSLPSNSGCTPR